MDQKTKSAASRAQILDAAVKEFASINYEKASINQICRDGQITKGRLYYYFESKDQLYLAAVEHCLKKLETHLHSFSPEPGLPMEENILRFFAHWQEFWKQDASLLRFMGRAQEAPPDHLRTEINQTRLEFRKHGSLDVLQELFRLYFPNDENRQRLFALISNVAIEYIFMYVGMMQMNYADRHPDFFTWQTQMFQTLLHIFLHGCMNVEVPPLDF